MKKLILSILMFAVVFAATVYGAQELRSSAFDVSGVVTSVSPTEVRLSQKYAPNHYFLYIFLVTNKTRIIGLVKKGSFVRVKYIQMEVIGGFFTTALEIQVLHEPNAYYQRMY